jgi:hypothetical protein
MFLHLVFACLMPFAEMASSFCASGCLSWFDLPDYGLHHQYKADSIQIQAHHRAAQFVPAVGR